MHRDIKPGNILINERGPLFCDFGMARTLSQSCQSKHQGNSGRVRGSILGKLQEKRAGYSTEQAQEAIAIKLTKIQACSK